MALACARPHEKRNQGREDAKGAQAPGYSGHFDLYDDTEVSGPKHIQYFSRWLAAK